MLDGSAFFVEINRMWFKHRFFKIQCHLVYIKDTLMFWIIIYITKICSLLEFKLWKRGFIYGPILHNKVNVRKHVMWENCWPNNEKPRSMFPVRFFICVFQQESSCWQCPLMWPACFTLFTVFIKQCLMTSMQYIKVVFKLK